MEPPGVHVTPSRGAMLFLSVACAPGVNNGLNALVIGVISRSYRTPRFSVTFCRRHLSCMKSTNTSVGIRMSLSFGTLMKRRSGYVDGSFLLKDLSEGMLNLPFMSV